MNFSIVCNNSGGQIFSLAAFDRENPLLLDDIYNPPSPLLIVLVVVVVTLVANFDPNKLPLPKSDVVVVGAPKVTFPVVAVADGAPNVNVEVVAGVPKESPPNKGADVVGAGNKLLAVVVLVVFDPKSKPVDCVCAAVAGVLLNPKLSPVVVAGVDGVPKVNVGAEVLEPKGVLVKLEPVAGFCPNPKLALLEVVGVPKVNVYIVVACNKE